VPHRRRRALVALPLLVGALALNGCAPHALGFEHDDTVRQGFTASNGRAWGGVDLDNRTDHVVTLRDLRVTGLSNARITSVEVIRTTNGNGIGFYPTDLTPGMRAEFRAARPLDGFTIPAHSHEIYEAVFQVVAVDRSRDATTKDVVVTYDSGGRSWSETRHSGFCLAVRVFRGCAA
jgi:hypothetical protein